MYFAALVIFCVAAAVAAANTVSLEIHTCFSGFNSFSDFAISFPEYPGVGQVPVAFTSASNSIVTHSLALPGTVAETKSFKIHATSNDAWCISKILVDGKLVKDSISWVDRPCGNFPQFPACEEVVEVPVFVEPVSFSFQTCIAAEGQSSDAMYVIPDSENQFCSFSLGENHPSGGTLDISNAHKPAYKTSIFAVAPGYNEVDEWCVADTTVDGSAVALPFWADWTCADSTLYPTSECTTEVLATVPLNEGTQTLTVVGKTFGYTPLPTPFAPATTALVTADFPKAKPYMYAVSLGSPIVQYRPNGSLSATIGTAYFASYLGNNQYAIEGGDGPCPKAGGISRGGVLSVSCDLNSSSTVVETSLCVYEVALSGPEFC